MTDSDSSSSSGSAASAGPVTRLNLTQIMRSWKAQSAPPRGEVLFPVIRKLVILGLMDIIDWLDDCKFILPSSVKPVVDLLLESPATITARLTTWLVGQLDKIHNRLRMWKVLEVLLVSFARCLTGNDPDRDNEADIRALRKTPHHTAIITMLLEGSMLMLVKSSDGLGPVRPMSSIGKRALIIGEGSGRDRTAIEDFLAEIEDGPDGSDFRVLILGMIREVDHELGNRAFARHRQYFEDNINDQVMQLLLEDAINTKNLARFQELCLRHVNYVSCGKIIKIYRMALTEFIQWMESSPEMEYTAAEAREKFTTTVSCEALLPDVVQYTNWLVSLGHSRLVSGDVIYSLVNKLCFFPDGGGEREMAAVKNLMLSLLTVNSKHRVKSLAELFKRCDSMCRRSGFDSPVPPRVAQLMDAIGEAGLLTASATMPSLIHKLMTQTQSSPLISYMWNSAHARMPEDFRTRQVLEMLCSPSISSLLAPKSRSRTLDIIATPNPEMWLQFGMSFISFLLDINQHTTTLERRRPEEERLLWVEELVFQGFLQPLVAATSNPSIFFELSRIIAIYCSADTIRKMEERVKWGAFHKAYVGSLNSALVTILRSRGTDTMSTDCDSRCAQLVTSLGRCVNLNSATLRSGSKLTSNAPVELTRQFLKEIRLRLASSGTSDEEKVKLRSYADECLDVPTGFQFNNNSIITTLVNNDCFVGDKLLHKMLLNPGYLVEHGFFKERIEAYAAKNIREYIKEVIFSLKCSGAESKLKYLLRMKTPVSDHMNLSHGKLTLGSKKYTTQRPESWHSMLSLVRLIESSPPRCKSCSKSLQGEVYHDPAGDFNEYYCRPCSVTLAEKGSGVRRFPCAVCMMDAESLHINIMDCGHAYCADCIAMIADSSSTARCPECREALFEKKEKTERVDSSRAIEDFMAEMSIP